MSKFFFSISALAVSSIGCHHPTPDQTLRQEMAQGQATEHTRSMHTPTTQALEKRDASGATPLMRATHANDIATARHLIEAGADVNAKDHMQDSPYLYAGAHGYLDILNMTLEHGADLKSTNRYGGTALIPAAERGHIATVKRLIEAGVDVNHVNRLGWTALIEAVILGDGSQNYQLIVDALIQAGADVNFKDRQGVSVLQHARQRNYTEIEQRLIQAGAR